MNSITPMTVPLTLCPLAEQFRKRTRSAKLQPVAHRRLQFPGSAYFFVIAKVGNPTQAPRIIKQHGKRGESAARLRGHNCGDRSLAFGNSVRALVSDRLVWAASNRREARHVVSATTERPARRRGSHGRSDRLLGPSAGPR